MPATRRSAPAPTPVRQLAGYIAKFAPEMARRIRACRAELRRLLPTANELVYDNYNFFVIGYCATERPSDCIVSLAASANGVALSFYRGSDVPDPKHLLQGSGKQNRYLRLPGPELLRAPDVLELIAAAVARADPPLPASRQGRLIVRSVSAKQRARRKDD